MSDYGDVDAGHESYEGQEHSLEAADQQYGAEQDQSLAHAQYGEADHHELDQSFTNVHHVEYDDGHGGHYEETTYTVVEVHEESSHQEFGEQLNAADHAQVDSAESFSAIEVFQEHFTEFSENFGKLGSIGNVGEIGHGSDFSDADFGLGAADASGDDDTGFDTGHGELSAASN
jgi:hypothetical protein